MGCACDFPLSLDEGEGDACLIPMLVVQQGMVRLVRVTRSFTTCLQRLPGNYTGSTIPSGSFPAINNFAFSTALSTLFWRASTLIPAW